MANREDHEDDEFLPMHLHGPKRPRSPVWSPKELFVAPIFFVLGRYYGNPMQVKLAKEELESVLTKYELLVACDRELAPSRGTIRWWETSSSTVSELRAWGLMIPGERGWWTEAPPGREKYESLLADLGCITREEVMGRGRYELIRLGRRMIPSTKSR